MKKYITRISALSMTSAMILAFNITGVDAATVNKEQSTVQASMEKLNDVMNSIQEKGVAGVNIRTALIDSGNQETKANAAEEIIENIVAASEQEASDKKDTTKEEQEQEKQKEAKQQEEKIPLNLKYDRLGIANVSNYLNIREKPGEDQKIIGKLPKNAGCNIYSIEDGWAKIKSGKVTGYVSAEFLVLDEKAEELAQKVGYMVATVNTTTLNVRALPSTDAIIYTLVPQDEQLKIKEQEVTEDLVNKLISEDEGILVNSLGTKVNTKQMKEQLSDWICVSIDNDIAFVSKEFVNLSYELERAVFVEELDTDGSSGVSSVRATMVQYAKQFLGNPYVWGGTSLTNGTDCSGFTSSIYRHFGYSISRTSVEQSTNGTRINVSDVKPGDLLFYSNGYRINHVTMYIGNGQVIHASNPSDGIKISNMYYRSPACAVRIIND